jgi:riboflavin synthase
MEAQMFSGIIEKLGGVSAINFDNGAMTCTVATGYSDLELGESVACNGVCLTVAKLSSYGDAEFFASSETLARTNLGALKTGAEINLERSVSLNTRLSGHVVQGHVDGLAKLTSVIEEAGAWRLVVNLPAGLGRYCVEKGSIALNGISLTINTLVDRPDGTHDIGLMIIPHTWDHTNLSSLAIGDDVNVEVDVMAKYVERLCTPYLKS